MDRKCRSLRPRTRRMGRDLIPVTVHTHIGAAREEIYDYLADLAARVAFTDHYLEQYHLTSPRSSGVGAGARFRLGGRWGEIVVVEAVRPRLLVEEGGLGRLGATRLYSEYELSHAGEGHTRVELTTGTQPRGRLGALREGFLWRRWYRRQSKVALERLRQVFEERPEGTLARTTVAGFEAAKSPRFGVSPRYRHRSHSDESASAAPGATG